MTYPDDPETADAREPAAGSEAGFRSRKVRDASLLLPIAGFFLITPPFVELFTTDVIIFGAPLIGVYLFSVWGLLVLAAFGLSRRLEKETRR